MHNTKSDITKNILAGSLKKLLKEKSLNKISIKEIVSDNGLNRQTFYYHFNDIYDLLDWIFKKEFLSIFNNYEGERLWQEGLKEFLYYIEDNRILCQNVIGFLGHDSMIRAFYMDISKLVIKAIDKISEGYEIDVEYRTQLIQYFTISFSSIIEQWTMGNISQTIDELVNFLDVIIKDQMRGTELRLNKK
ncbi:MAG: TetR/AcrR family transcriptional regulator C-terminal domain-containing protein [Clostridiales bacterium]|nr:TetR/AcrR family transcriptional regulator C-terminal domain-containing protein [Clostridiales bacterium]